MRHAIMLNTLLILSLCVMACGSRETTSEQGNLMPNTIDEETPERGDPMGEWTLVSVLSWGRDGAGEPVEIVEGQRLPTLEWSERGIAGFAGVNRFGGEFTPQGETLFGPVWLTRMAGPAPAMALEQAVVGWLSRVTDVDVEGDTLRLSDGETVGLVFRRTP